MADGFSIDIKGLSEVKAMLDGLPEKVQNRATRTALKAGAAIVQAEVEERAPIRPDVPAGTALPAGALKADIKTTIKKARNGDMYAVIEPGEYTAHVAELVEDGHRVVRGGYSHQVFRNGEATGKYRGPGRQLKDESGALQFVPPHPFVREAFEATAETAARLVATTLQEEVEKAAK